METSPFAEIAFGLAIVSFVWCFILQRDILELKERLEAIDRASAKEPRTEKPAEGEKLSTAATSPSADRRGEEPRET